LPTPPLKTNPRKIPGRWREGYALDLHSVSSEYAGEDQFGHARFVTSYTEAGKLLNQLKYSGDQKAVKPLVQALVKFLLEWLPEFDLIVPVPPTKKRAEQPVLLLARELGRRMGVEVDPTCVTKKSGLPAIKDVRGYDARMKVLEAAFTVKGVKGRNVLLFDDIYDSGATINAVANALQDMGRTANVIALAVTQTRTHR
jgi:competence protein ComFC